MELVVFGGLMALMWALLIVPQQRRTKAHRAMLDALDVGDEVVTASGIYGTITEFDGETVFLAVSDDVEMKMSKASITEQVVYADAE